LNINVNPNTPITTSQTKVTTNVTPTKSKINGNPNTPKLNINVNPNTSITTSQTKTTQNFVNNESDQEITLESNENSEFLDFLTRGIILSQSQIDSLLNEGINSLSDFQFISDADFERNHGIKGVKIKRIRAKTGPFVDE